MEEEEYDEPCLSFINRHEVICLLKGIHLVQRQALYGLRKTPNFVPDPGKIDVNKATLGTCSALQSELRKILKTFFKESGCNQ